MHTVAAVAARSTLESLESLNKDSALCSTPALPIAHAKECVSVGDSGLFLHFVPLRCRYGRVLRCLIVFMNGQHPRAELP